MFIAADRARPFTAYPEPPDDIVIAT